MVRHRSALLVSCAGRGEGKVRRSAIKRAARARGAGEQFSAQHARARAQATPAAKVRARQHLTVPCVCSVATECGAREHVWCDRVASFNIQSRRGEVLAGNLCVCVWRDAAQTSMRARKSGWYKAPRNIAKDPVPVTASQQRNALRRCGLNATFSLDILRVGNFLFERALRFHYQTTAMAD